MKSGFYSLIHSSTKHIYLTTTMYQAIFKALEVTSELRQILLCTFFQLLLDLTYIILSKNFGHTNKTDFKP